jgi:hypothetical protein
MDVTRLLERWHGAVKKLKQQHLSQLMAKLPIGLTLGLCSCMLWQCSTCLIKYMGSPIGATVAFSTDLTQWAPIAITVCSKVPNSTNTCPELAAVDVQQLEEGKNSKWKNIWRPFPLANDETSTVSLFNFVTIFEKGKFKPCKTINVYESKPSAIRLQHYFNKTANLNRMEVYLHMRGLFHSQDYLLQLPKKILVETEKSILELKLETLASLPLAEFNCTQSEEAMILDSCLLAEANKAANKSARCLPK